MAWVETRLAPPTTVAVHDFCEVCPGGHSQRS